MMSIELAAVNPDLLHAAFLEAFSDYAMDSRGTTESTLLLRMSKNAVQYGASVGAYADGKMVGFTLIGIDTMPQGLTAYDAATRLIPAYRGKGIARQMFDHALPELRSRGVKQFVLEVLQENGPAIKAYRSCGFEIARTLRCYVANIGDLMAQTPSEVTLHGAYDGEECVGIMAYCARLNWLLSLIVQRTHRRRGIGRRLLGHLVRRLPQGVQHLAVLNVDGDDTGM